MRLKLRCLYALMGLFLTGCALPFGNMHVDIITFPTAEATGSGLALASCPVTKPQQPLFAAPASNQATAPWSDEFWYGTDALWTVLPNTGIWNDLPHNPEGYSQKVLCWRKGYFWKREPQPMLSVTGQRLDAPAPPLHVSKATNAFAEDIQSAMLVGVDFPTLGCWKITGRYSNAELSFIILVAR